MSPSLKRRRALTRHIRRAGSRITSLPLTAARRAVLGCAVMTLLVACSASATSSGPQLSSGTTRITLSRLPTVLLGFHQLDPAVQRALRQRLSETAQAHGLPLADPEIAAYGTQGGSGMTVLATKMAPGSYGPLGDVARGLADSLGIKTMQSFPAGPKGGVLSCGAKASGGGMFFICTWADTAGVVGFASFYYGTATGLPDAASKTIQVRSLIEH